MHRYYVDTIKESKRIYFIVRFIKDASIITEPTKYLKNKTMQRRSPNTVRRIAYALTYYMEYLEETGLTIMDVLEMGYSKQHEHFTSFLVWLREGNHSDRNRVANNNTCNSYLQSVFGYYLFLINEYDHGDIKVLENRQISFTNSVGVRFRRSVQAFQGYLPRQESTGKSIEKDKIITLLENSKSLRMQLMILMLAETGFRIGELLGIRYGEDIDYEKKAVRVEYREDNENDARAKNAEYRHARLSDETFDFLLLYISEYRDMLAKSKYLFICMHGKTKGQPLTEYAVYSAFGVLERATGIKCTPHMLRHYYANERRSAGWALETISASLGHKHLETTEKYLHVTDEEMAEAMDGYFENNSGLYDISGLI